MKKHINPAIRAHLLRGAFCLLLLLIVCVIPFALGQLQPDVRSQNQSPTGFVCFGCPSNGWHPGPDMPSTAVRTVGVLASNGKFYAMGGRSMDGVGNDFTHPFEYSGGYSGTWTIKSATYPDNQVSNMACGVLTDSGTNYIYCVGGSAGGQTTATSRMFRYNPVNDTITTIPASWPGDADGITLPGGFSVFNNKLYILGGFRINTGMIYPQPPSSVAFIRVEAAPGMERRFMIVTTHFRMTQQLTLSRPFPAYRGLQARLKRLPSHCFSSPFTRCGSWAAVEMRPTHRMR